MALALALTVPISLYPHTSLTSQFFTPSIKSPRGCSKKIKSPCGQDPCTIRCVGASLKDEKIVRRSANYQPSLWDYDYMQSLSSKYMGDAYLTRATKLKEDVKKNLKVADLLDGLEMIDDLQRLGIFYHFEGEIKRFLESVYNNICDDSEDDHLHATCLKFRLLRQHGYNVPLEVFDKFLDETGHFKASLSKDIRGILYLYEASFHSFSGENILEEAKHFATQCLEQYLKKNDINQDLALLISHALEFPLHWRMLRLEARWFIEFCERRPNMNPTLLELAKLDFNMVQTTHLEDLKYASRQWNQIGLGKNLSFARDSLMECFLWAIGQNFKPKFSNFRRYQAVANALVVMVDDVYDIYGTLDELEVFTNAVERWDISVMKHLPNYMKICFLGLFNTINQMGYEILKEQGVHIIPHFQKQWADLCKCYLKEAKWYYSGYTPTLEEYVENAWMSIGAPLGLTYACFFCTNPVDMECFDLLLKYANMVQWASTIARLADDLGTSQDEMKRGDTLKSVQCYMRETGASEEDAREHIKYLIEKMWKKMNEDQITDSPSSQALVETAMNGARMALCMYQYGDGHGTQRRETKDRVLSLFVNPFPLEY